MTPSRHQYLVDEEGNRVAVLMGIEDYRKMKGQAERYEAMRDLSDAAEQTTTTLDGRMDEDLEALGLRSFP